MIVANITGRCGGKTEGIENGCRLSVASIEKKDAAPIWIEVTIWGVLAERIAEQAAPGLKIWVSGRLSVHEKYGLQMRCDHAMVFGDRKESKDAERPKASDKPRDDYRGGHR